MHGWEASSNYCQARRQDQLTEVVLQVVLLKRRDLYLDIEGETFIDCTLDKVGQYFSMFSDLAKIEGFGKTTLIVARNFVDFFGDFTPHHGGLE